MRPDFLVATVSRRALVENARAIDTRVAPSSLAVVVKDDAYAHGLEPVVEALSAAGFHRYGALDMTNALRVRRIDPGAMIFTWVFGADDSLSEAIKADLDLGVSYGEILERVESAARAVGRRARVHLKIDTGLHRAGVTAHEWEAFVTRAASLEREGLIDVVGIWTHIAEASYDSDSESIARFKRAIDVARSVGLHPRLRHLAASAASFEREDARFDMVRVGAFVYGIAPGDGIGPESLGLTPALTLTTQLVDLKESEGQILGAIPVGQVHGLYSDASGTVAVSVNQRLCTVENVGPNVCWVDVTEAEAQIGNPVYLFGSGQHGEQTLQQWADAMGTIGEELVIRLAHRAAHCYVD